MKISTLHYNKALRRTPEGLFSTAKKEKSTRPFGQMLSPLHGLTGNCINRARTGARTAVNASVLVDDELAVAGGNAADRAGALASAAANACVRNCVCHNKKPPTLCVSIYCTTEPYKNQVKNMAKWKKNLQKVRRV
jgi:hypothetical protein